jgi:hypothetical protein
VAWRFLVIATRSQRIDPKFYTEYENDIFDALLEADSNSIHSFPSQHALGTNEAFIMSLAYAICRLADTADLSIRGCSWSWADAFHFLGGNLFQKQIYFDHLPNLHPLE